MAINASVDGTSYENITKITAGGKEINLSYYDDGGDLPQGIAEIKMGSFKPDSVIYSDYNVAHGCSGTPDIIVLTSDYKTAYTSELKPSNTVIAGDVWIGGLGKFVATISTSYTGESSASTVTGQSIGGSSDGNISSVDGTNFTIAAKSNRRMETNVTYTWIAIRLA